MTSVNIQTSLKYCVYLKGLPTESLTEEEQDFMRTMAEVDAWYEAEIARAKRENQQEIALKMLQKNLSLEMIVELTDLSIEQIQQLQSRLGNIATA